MNRYYDEHLRHQGDRDRDRDDWRSEEWRGSERSERESFHPGNHGFQEGEYTGRTAGSPDRQPYSQNPYGYYPGQGRQGRQWGERSTWPQRYGQREPYNTRRYGASRYSESQYGTRRGGDDEYGSPFGEGPFADTSESPGYFGSGYYGDGGANFTGGYDQRSRTRNYGSLGEDMFQSGERTGPRYRTGPKGYTRSDDRLREDISERLMMADSIDSSEVTISVKDGKATLEGTVPARFMKHSIEDIVDAAPGVRDIDNRIRVERVEGAYAASQRGFPASQGGATSGSETQGASGSGAGSGTTGNGGRSTKQ